MTQTLRIGARGSLLSTRQTGLVAAAIQNANPGLNIQIIPIKTTGDVVLDRPLSEIGGKGLFTREIQRALVDGRIDLAVHSFKDLPITQPLVDTLPLTVAATLPREDPRDLLISSNGFTLENLPKNARVGTSSLRRRAQLLAMRPDLTLLPLRGNIDTRINKAMKGEFDAIVLAYAGMIRSGLFDPAKMIPIDPDLILPAPAQGALCLECRKDDAQTLQWVAPLNHPQTMSGVQIERKMVELLNGDCHSPIAALALFCKNAWSLKVRVGMPGGEPPVHQAEVAGAMAEDLPQMALQELLKKGVVVNPTPKSFLDDNIQKMG